MGNNRGNVIKEQHRLEGQTIRQTIAKERIAKALSIINELKENGFTTLQAIADEMNRRSIRTARGGKWYPSNVHMIIKGKVLIAGKGYIIKEQHRLEGQTIRQNIAKERIAKTLPIIKEIQKNGFITLQSIADEMNRRGISTARGGKWHRSSVYIVINSKKM